MKLGRWLFGLGAAGFGILAYGALVESKRLVLERYRLRVPGWPSRLDGFTIALLADFHLRDGHSAELAERAIALALDAEPDMVVLAGDFVGLWTGDAPKMVGDVLEPLLLMEGRVVAVPGNHDYLGYGNADLLGAICDALNIRLLRNASWANQGIRWVGIDSFNAGYADPAAAFGTIPHGASEPIVVVWHEPDLVVTLPPGASLMLSGHSHGGQFLAPWGWAPMSTENGRRYVRGYYPEAATPLFVTRGVGTTGPPSRLFCRPEVALLEIGC